MAIKTRDLTREWRRGDAERLARLFNESSAGWPSGAWDPKTPKEAEREVRETPLLGAFIADEGDHFAAFCSLYAKPEERNRAYVPLLTALPSYHGKGYGKAVLHRSVERVYDLGIARVDLHTWPGNLKAVPLYKKTGFMWAPDEPWGVLMQNFTPGARRHPVAAAYFAKHDWYRTMQRDLALEADDHKRGKVRVYPYLWEEGGDRLRLVYDRNSWGLVEVETNEFCVGCWLEEEKLVAGLPQRIRWEILNHTDKPLEVALIASGEEGIALDRKEFLQVKRRAQVEAEFLISPDLPEKEKEPRAPIVRTDLLVNGQPIALAAGFEAKQAVHFGLEAGATGLRPGRPERIVVQAWSELDRPATATVRLSASAGSTLETTEATVQLPAKGSAEVPVPVVVAESGLLEVRAEATVTTGTQTVTPKADTLSAFALAPGEVRGRVEKHSVVLESAALRLTLWRRGGYASVFDKVRNRNLAGIPAPVVGPPMAWEDFFDTPCDARIEQDGARVTAVVTTPSVHRPGVRLERRLTLSNLPLIGIDDTVINGGAHELKGRIQTRASFHMRRGYAVAMTEKGLVRTPRDTAGRSLGEHNLYDEGQRWPESWVAEEDFTGAAAGLLWDRATRITCEHWGKSFERPFAAIAPGQSVSLGTTYLFVGEGNYLTVRRWWQMLFGERVTDDQPLPETRLPLRFGLQPNPLVLHGPSATAKLVVDSVGRLEFAGLLTAKAPEALRLQPARLEFKGVCESKPAAQSVTVARRPGAVEGAYAVDCTAQMDRIVYHESQPVLVLGEAAKQVTVQAAGEKGEHFRVDNGVLTMTVAPEFCGSVISLRRGEEELLRSAYPEARPLAWENPWFGGVSPGLESLGRDLAKEHFTARPIQRRGSQGIIWQGVRVGCSPKQDRARHDRLELDYLLAPGSSVLAVVVRTTRRTDTAGGLGAAVTFWPVLGGSFLEAALRIGDDTRAELLRADFGRGAGDRRWVLAENPKAKQAVVACTTDDRSWVQAQVFGGDGYFLSVHHGARHAARETKEAVFLFGYTTTETARAWAEGLSKLRGLP